MSTSPRRILLVDTDARISLLLRGYLTNAESGRTDTLVENRRSEDLLQDPHPDVSAMLVAEKPGSTAAIDLLRAVRATGNRVPVIVLGEHHTIEPDDGPISAGADDHLDLADLTPLGLNRAIHNAIARQEYLASRQNAEKAAAVGMHESVDEIRGSEERYRLALEASAVVLFMQDRELRYTWAANTPSRRVTDVIGRRHEDLFAPDEAAELTRFTQLVLDTGVGGQAMIPLTVDGTRRYYDIIVKPLRDADGEIIGLIGSGIDRTGLYESRKALHRNQALFQAFVDHFPALTYIKAADGRYLIVNRRLAEILGRAPEEITGRTDAELFPAELAARYQQADRDVIDQMRTIETVETDRTDGVTTYWQSTKFPVIDESGAVMVGGSTIEITDRVRAEQSLRQQRQRMDDLVSSIPGIVWEVWYEPDEERRRINFVNDHVESLLGYTREEWLAKPDFWQSIIHPDDRARAAASAVDETAPGEIRQMQFRWITRDGRTIWVEVHWLGIFDASGTQIGRRGVTMDITDRVEAEQALIEANDRLELRVEERTSEIVRMMKKLEQATRAQKRFIADASHDLRTPLTVLRAELDLLLGRTMEPEIRQALRRLDAEARRLDSLTGDLLVLATLEAREPSTLFRSERLDLLISECASQLGGVALAHGISWRVESGEQLEMECDATSIRRMLRNLMENAIKYTAAGGTVTMTARKVVETASRSRHRKPRERIEIVVSDSGAGIAPEDLPHVFKRFYRGDSTRSTPGTGLGLAIVKAVADAHGGRVSIDSEVGRGTTVTVSFPAGSAARRSRSETSQSSPRSDGESQPPTGRQPMTARLDEIVFDLLMEAESDLGTLAAGRNVSWQIICEESIEISTSPDALKRAIMKMIESAVRNSPDGGIVEVEICEVEDHPDHAEIVVRDGGGERDERLPITGAVADSLGGSLEIEHSPDGTTVTMRLPL